MITEATRRRRAKVKLAFNAMMTCYPLTTDDLDGEEWRDVEGYDGDYKVSNFGRVKSLKRGKVKILKPMLQGDYIYVYLCKDGKETSITIHRLVAKAFVPNPEGKPEVNHIDGNKLNNCAENFEWTTHSENLRHAIDTGLEIPFRGEQQRRAKLTNEQARYIRDNPDNLTGVQLAKMFGVSTAVISDIQLGKGYSVAGGTARGSKIRRVPDEIREEIRRLYKKGVPGSGLQALARKFGISVERVSTIVREGAPKL